MHIKEMADRIKDANLEDKLVIFVGAGVSNNSGYKTWQELIRVMDTTIKYSSDPMNKRYSSDELLRIPQFLKKEAPSKYKDIIRKNFGTDPEEANKIVDSILKFKPHHIITTNFDCLIEYSIQKIHKEIRESRTQNEYALVRKDQDLISIKKNNLLIKMHGDVEAFEHIILAEDDYLNYSNTHILIETFIKSLLIDHTFLFIGYSIGDYNLKLIMNWVDNIVSKYDSNLTQRRPHFFINSDIKPVSKYDRKYFSDKNIYVLEPSYLPKEIQQTDVEDISDIRGKNTFHVIQYIIQEKPSNKSVKFLYKKLKPFSKLGIDRIVFWDITEVLGGGIFFSRLIDGILYYNNYSELIRIAINAFLNENVQSTYIKSVFIKAGVERIICVEDKEEFILQPNLESNDILKAILHYDFETIYQYIGTNCEDNLYHAYLLMLVDDEVNTKKTLASLREEIKSQSYARQIIYAHNNMQGIHANAITPYEIIEILTKNEKKYITPLCDLVYNFHDLKADLSVESQKLMHKYSPYSNDSITEFGVENGDFKALRYRIIDIIKYFISNGVYTFGCYRSTCNLSGLSELLEIYIDIILFLQSSNCKKTKYECIELHNLDLFIMISYIKPKKLTLLLEKHNIKKLYLSKKCIDYLLNTLKNIIEEQKRRIIGKQDGEFFLSNLINGIFTILKVTCLNDLIVNDLVITANIILRFSTLEANEYNDIVIRDIYYNAILVIWRFIDKPFGKEVVDQLKETFLNIISAFNAENHSIEYSEILKRYIKPYRILINLAKILSKHNCIIENYEIDRYIKTVLDYYRFENFLLIDVYNLCSNVNRSYIAKELNKKIHTMTSSDIFYSLDSKIISYDINVEIRLKDLCKRNIGIQKINDAGNLDSPFHAVARLKEIGILKDLSAFKEFADYNYFFSFVCFPEEFDYNHFEIEWYSWLQLEEYASVALKKAKSILCNKYKKGIEDGSTEDIKATYYRFFYET